MTVLTSSTTEGKVHGSWAAERSKKLKPGSSRSLALVQARAVGNFVTGDRAQMQSFSPQRAHGKGSSSKGASRRDRVAYSKEMRKSNRKPDKASSPHHTQSRRAYTMGASGNAFELALWKRHERTFLKHRVSADVLARSRAPASTWVDYSGGDRRTRVPVPSEAGRSTRTMLRRYAESSVADFAVFISFLAAAMVGLLFGACIHLYRD